MSQADLMTGLYTLLTTNQAAGSLYARVNGRISWLSDEFEAAIDGSLPALLTYQIITDIPQRALVAGEDGYRELTMQFDVYSLRSAGASAHSLIINALRVAADRKAITASNFDDVQLWLDDYGAPVIEDKALRTTIPATMMAQ